MESPIDTTRPPCREVRGPVAVEPNNFELAFCIFHEVQSPPDKATREHGLLAWQDLIDGDCFVTTGLDRLMHAGIAWVCVDFAQPDAIETGWRPGMVEPRIRMTNSVGEPVATRRVIEDLGSDLAGYFDDECPEGWARWV